MEKLKTLERGLFKAAMALSLGGLVVAGCTEPGQALDSSRPAKVLQHEYHRPYMTILPAGKVMIPIQHEEEFHLSVIQCEGELFEPTPINRCVSAHVDVSRDTYNKFPDGSVIALKG